MFYGWNSCEVLLIQKIEMYTKEDVGAQTDPGAKW